jgi:hypothetical protein
MSCLRKIHLKDEAHKMIPDINSIKPSPSDFLAELMRKLVLAPH